MATPFDRVMRRIDRTAECWLWTGATNKSGYAVVQRGRGLGMAYAHRVVYEEIVGPIPDGLVIDHLCRVRHCVRPSHLEPVSSGENVLRGDGPSAQAARRGSCIHGHAYTPENTYLYRGVRQCRICRDHHREVWRARSKGGVSPFSTSPTLVEQP